MPLTLALHAMATRFEIVLHGDNPTRLRAAGEEALEEIARLEAQLSLYRATSEIAHVNARAAAGPVRITPSLFALLDQARKLHQESDGAFDITIAPLVQCWGFMSGSGHLPEPQTLADARARVGMDHLELDPENLTVRFARGGMMLDLGAIGKGYAIERAAEVLREAGVTSALLHGGTSTACALGNPPDAEAWKVAVEYRRQGLNLSPAVLSPTDEGQRPAAEPDSGDSPAPLLATVPLRDQALSVSGVMGRFFEAEGRTYGHVLDPRTGRPAASACLAAVVLPSATETDALSTALLVLGAEGHERIARLRPGMRTLLVEESTGGLHIEGRGIQAERR